jgi:hypothetical protein
VAAAAGNGTVRELLAGAARRSERGWESRVAGRSMAPAIPDGATIRIVPLDPACALESGAVLACLSAGNTLFAHRLVRWQAWRGRRFALTLGDGWRLCDPPTPAADVVGRVDQYHDGDDWRAPPEAGPRRGLSAWLAHGSLACVSLALQVHPWLARRVAGCGLALGSVLKGMHGRLG